MELKQIKVWVLVEDGGYTIVDAGMRRRARLGKGDLAKPTRRAREREVWREWALASAARVNESRSRTQARMDDPWVRKIEAWMASLRKREMDLLRIRAGPPVRGLYPTVAWPGAIARMWHQANNKWARHRRSGWERWCQSVTNNSNKRKGARYARDSMQREARGDQGERPAKTAGDAGLQLCFDW